MSGNQTWRDRFTHWRNHIIARPQFQRWAAAFPLTRAIAQKNAADLFDLCAGFVYSQILFAAVRLELFDLLNGEPLTAACVAQQKKLDVRSAQTLLEAGAALRLFERRSAGRFGLGELGAALIGNKAVIDMISHHSALYADLGDPVALLRDRPKDAALSQFWGYAAAADPTRLDDVQVAEYSALMAASQSFIADDVLDACSLAKHRHLLDIGGGEGAFVKTALARYPGLSATVFDLPAVAEKARTGFAAAGLSDRVTVIGGDFHNDALPRGADVVTLVRVLHDHDDGLAKALLRSARNVLPSGGALLIAEPMAEAQRTEARVSAYFGFYLLAMGSGRPRSAAELLGYLTLAGFRSAQIIPTIRPMLVRAIRAIV